MLDVKRSNYCRLDPSVSKRNSSPRKGLISLSSKPTLPSVILFLIRGLKSGFAKNIKRVTLKDRK
jgi:hypothetical protein